MQLSPQESLRKLRDLENLVWNRSLYVLHDSIVHPEVTIPRELTVNCTPIAQALILALDAEPRP